MVSRFLHLNCLSLTDYDRSAPDRFNTQRGIGPINSISRKDAPGMVLFRCQVSDLIYLYSNIMVRPKNLARHLRTQEHRRRMELIGLKDEASK